MKITIIVVLLVALVSLGAVGYLYTQNLASQNKIEQLNQQLSRLEDEKTKIETELMILKATDLAKEAEVLTLKLASAEKDFASTQKNLVIVEKSRSDLALDFYRLKSNLAKIPAYLNAIDAMEDIAAQGPNQTNVAAVDAKVALLKDDAISSRWQTARAGINIEKQAWMGGLIADTVRMITLTMGKLVSP